MIYKVGIIIFIYLFVACSSAERKEAVTVGELFRQAAFYGERLQYIPALDTYQQAIRLAERIKTALLFLMAIWKWEKFTGINL